MGIKELGYRELEKEIEASITCRKLSDAKRFVNKQLNYLENKTVNKMKISIIVSFNDKKWEE